MNSNWPTVTPGKNLPIGFHDFVPIAPELRTRAVSKGNDVVVCRRMENAISFGKRIDAGLSPAAALQALHQAWGGDRPCDYAPAGLELQAIAYAVRGDDRGKPILILRFLDQHGDEHFGGAANPTE
jgi:hypothetical protein